MADDLFDGEESANSSTNSKANSGEEVLPNDQPPLGGDQSIGIEAWLKDLTYREVHAFVAGFAPVLVGLLLIVAAPALAGEVLVAGVGLTLAALGERKLRNRALRYIVKEPHYLLGGQALAVLVGVIVLGTIQVLGFSITGIEATLRAIARSVVGL